MFLVFTLHPFTLHPLLYIQEQSWLWPFHILPLFVYDFWQFSGKLVRCFVEYLSTGLSLMVFLWLNWGCVLLWVTSKRQSAVFITSYQEYTSETWLINVDVDIIVLLMKCLWAFLTPKLHPFPYSTLWGLYAQPALDE